MKRCAFIPVRPPSANAWAGRRSWKTYFGIKKKWEKTIALYFPMSDRQPVPSKLTIVSHYCHPAKIYDHDNFIGGLKPIIDCLRKQAWIYDDTLVYLVMDAKQEKSDKNGVQITVERMD